MEINYKHCLIVSEISEIQVRSRRLVCENTKFDVFFEHLIDSTNGHDVPNFLIVSPKTQSPGLVTGVAILPICDGNVGLVRMYRPPIKDWSWEIPHGFIEINEQSKTAALRELAEEAGVDVQSIESLGLVTPDAGIIAGRVELYIAICTKTERHQVREFGLGDFCWFENKKILKMIENSELQDSLTLSAYCKYILTA